MNHWLNSKRVVWTATGIIIGLILGGFIPDSPLHAVGTDRQENFALATGMVDEGVEAVYMLDFLTGDLRAAVLNPTSRQFANFYQRNITTDLKVEKGKSPRYVMITGEADLRGGGQGQFASSVLYVAELSSGYMGVYALPFSPAALTRGGGGQTQFLIPLQVVAFRTGAVRPQ
jgi:hypothetical protein